MSSFGHNKHEKFQFSPRATMLAWLKTSLHIKTSWMFSLRKSSSVVFRLKGLAVYSGETLKSEFSFDCDS